MTTGVPQLFDKALRRRHLARAGTTRPPFYAQALAAEVESRLGLILRDFKSTLIFGPAAGEIRTALAGLKRLGNIITAAPVPGPGIDLVFDDEAVPLAPESLDCIISLFGLHSVNDVPGSLAQFRAALRPDGLFLGGLFAGRTLTELREAWLAAEADLTGGASLRVAPFADMRDVGALMQRAGFALPAVDLDQTTVRYKNALALMREIKAIGLQHCLSDRSRRPVTLALLARAAALYEAADGRGWARSSPWRTGCPMCKAVPVRRSTRRSAGAFRSRRTNMCNCACN